MNSLVIDGREVAAVELATSARSRSRGLLGRTGMDGAIWLAPARQVHTFRMKFAIDVAHVDRSGRVLHTCTMPPGRLGRLHLRAAGVLEATAGDFAAWGLVPGCRVTMPDATAPLPLGVDPAPLALPRFPAVGPATP